jgi:N-acetylglucosaminyldiphosphoundecaprenol N-acetyl-beta-D-mannosaminyltransferase
MSNGVNKVDIAGLKIDSITKADLLKQLTARIKSGQKTWVTTPYSEFLHAGLMDGRMMDVLNQADFAVADGIGMFWAKKYLEIPLAAKSYWGKILQAIWQIKYSLAAILFYPKWIKSVLPEKISGSDLIWDLAKLAADNNLSVYFLGGFGDTSEIASKKISTRINHGRDFSKYLKIAGWSNKNSADPTIIDDINKTSPDILFVAFDPIKQEKWILQNLPKLNFKLAIGLGGTFDYLAGKQPQPPQFIRKIGLEWLWRLFTQPKRYKRIYNATFGLATFLLRYKVFMSYPMRENVVIVVLNSENKIFLGKKKPDHFKIDIIGDADKAKRENYWQLPQGGTDGELNLEKAARREAQEEINITSLKLIGVSKRHNEYIWSNSLRKLLDNKGYKNKGQRQSIVYFRFIGSDNEIKFPKNEEFSEYQWVKISELNKIVHPERGAIVKILQEDLKKMQENAII